MMQERLIRHIKRKLFKTGEVLDEFDVPSDEQIWYFMIATFEIVENECQNCYYCKNYRRFTLWSLCRIKPHIESDCFHFTLDINKVLKKKYYDIIITINEATRGKNITRGGYLSTKTRRNLIYESIRLSEMVGLYRQINNVEEDITLEMFKSSFTGGCGF